MTLIDLFDRGWSTHRNRAAFVSGDERWTYEQAGRLSCRVARSLLREGLQAEDRVAVYAPNDITAWVTVLGIFRAGGAWVPLNPMSPVADAADLVTRFDGRFLFVHASLAGSIPQLRQIVGDDVRIIVLDDATATGADATLPEFLADEPETDPGVTIEPGQLAMVAPTGGTTGKPKGVMSTHRSLGTTMMNLLNLIHYDADEHPVNLAAAPMTHSAGLMTLPVSARGGTVVLLARPVIADILTMMETHGVTEIFLPPTVVYRLLEAPDLKDRDLSALRYILYSAAPMSVEKLKRGIELLGPIFAETYGQTEAPGTIAYLRPEQHVQADGSLAEDRILRSCGYVSPSIRMRILDEDSNPVAPGEPGEICVQGDLVMRGYYENPEATAETIIDGWLHTGDIGTLSDDGFLTITDRKKDMLISGGFNIYPAEVEQVIWSHPGVQECAVIGAPDPEWGESVTAYVELNPGAEVTAEELIALCRDKLGAVRSPKRIEFIESIPRSMNGKVLKKDLRALDAQRTGA